MIFGFQMTHCLYFFSIVIIPLLSLLLFGIIFYIYTHRIDALHSEDILTRESGQHVVQAVPIQNIPSNMHIAEVLSYRRNEELL